MRLLLAVTLLLSFSAYGQRVKENIKQRPSVQDPVDHSATKGTKAKPVKAIRR